MEELTLYGLNKTGGFKVWMISTDDQGLITVRHGTEHGKLQVKSEKVKGKNIGRANETTPAEQAVSEAEGKIKKQRDKGYRDTKAELTELPVIAMLATDFTKVGHRMEFPCYGSDKLDGVRCLAKKRGGIVTLESRTGQPYSVPHIEEQLTRFMKEGETFDGEIYLHGHVLQDITSAVKRTDTQKEIDKASRKMNKAFGGSVEEWETAKREHTEAVLIHELRPRLEFVVFDVLAPDLPADAPFEVRLGRLLYIRDFRPCDGPADNIKVLSYIEIDDLDDLKAAHAYAVKRGYEGLMLRSKKGVYESGKRSADLMKYKVFMDAEFKVIGYEIDKDGCIVYVCENDLNDLPFNVIFGTKEWKQAKALTAGEDNGKFLTVKFQSRYKGTLLPQFPTGVMFREGKLVNGVFIPSE